MKKDLIKFWKENNIFEKSLERDNDFVFYDGPPFATGTPHYGHLLASTIKDVIPRFKAMNGYKVNRRFGWDCHGLPIEHEINKSLNMTAQEAVKSLGVKGYNNECRGIVSRYTNEWEETVTNLGRWVDFQNDYKTMDPNFMESVWFIFKSLFDKGLVYKGTKVLPYSTGLNTVLSNFEASSNYKNVNDESVTVLFQLESGEYLSVWTTTPWTLPVNAAICVNKNIKYVSYKENNKTIITSFAKYSKEFNSEDYEEMFDGQLLVGRKYKPLFNSNYNLIVEDDYVSEDSGTGIVHLAPYFGEDDNRVCTKNKILGEDHLDTEGKFTKYFPGTYFKDANKLVIDKIKQDGLLLKRETINHSYPFCPRTGVPLIYRAIPAWYISVESIKDDLVKTNQEINWTPNHIKDGRFGNWLANAKDWCVSRNRVWGTPIPLWINDITGNVKCIGSIQELTALSGHYVNDLHRENVDHIQFSIDGEDGSYKRIDEVLDCWFESGCMPYASIHYPFENKEYFEKNFPAEFIAEGLDQTRGWFYSLHVISTALFNKPVFKNVIVNGLVLAENGIKMSKSLKNYTDPNILIDEFGADAVRLYMLNSGLTRGEEQHFSDAGVKSIVKDVILPIRNSLKFFQTYADLDNFKYKKEEVNNITDKWILSKLYNLSNNVKDNINNYKLYSVCKDIFGFINDLTNWYIRLNRSRFWQENCQDKNEAYYTLYTCLLNLSKVIAPLAPFVSEEVFLELKKYSELEESVHLCSWPEIYNYNNEELESLFSDLQEVILLGRKKREQEKIKTKIPLNYLTIFGSKEMSTVGKYIKSELNVKNIYYSSDKIFDVVIKPNFKELNNDKQNISHMKAFISILNEETLKEAINCGKLKESYVLIEKKSKDKNVLVGNNLALILDVNLTDELLEEGFVREIISAIQNKRKVEGFNVSDRINIIVSCDTNVAKTINNYKEYIQKETLSSNIFFDSFSGDIDIDGKMVGLRLNIT